MLDEFVLVGEDGEVEVFVFGVDVSDFGVDFVCDGNGVGVVLFLDVEVY